MHDLEGRMGATASGLCVLHGEIGAGAIPEGGVKLGKA